MASDWIDEVLRFWFDELNSDAWFRKDERVDALIRERFAALHARVSTMQPEDLATPDACLAAVIVLDQFSRNMFRGSHRAFASDTLALSIAQRALEAGFDRDMDKNHRLFLYMPLQHCEDPLMQQRCVELLTALNDRELLDYAHRHKEIIDRFGRFPHRNAILGRVSSGEELEFMKTHRGF
jgi:uncharacterized protein (DUF924 family)